jgi:thymidylate synthase
MFLGVPWNILSYSVLTYLLAYRHDLTPKELIISTGDTHVYINHLNQMHTQRKRDPLAYPILTLHPDIKTKTIDELSIDDFDLIGYFPHASIKGTMSV